MEEKTTFAMKKHKPMEVLTRARAQCETLRAGESSRCAALMQKLVQDEIVGWEFSRFPIGPQNNPLSQKKNLLTFHEILVDS